MSNFSTVYDFLIGTTIPALSGFSSKTQIPNPYDIQYNDKNFLRNGWGILVGASSETDYQEYNFTRVGQELGIILTREVQGTEHNKTPLETATKLLIEDAVAIRLDFYNADQLTLDANIENIVFLGRSPVQYVGLDGYNIIFTIVNFSFELKESL